MSGFGAPFTRIGPDRLASPVILSVPHAGRDYRPALIAAARVPRAALESLEDRLVDRLVWRAAEAGATAFVASAPRAEIDLNREESEIDPSLISPPLAPSATNPSARSRGGLGLIPSRIGSLGAIWNDRIARTELDRRLQQIHRPYHQALAAAMKEARERFGCALLLDCHSMPPRAPASGQASIIFGDRHGTSCAADLVEVAVETAGSMGFETACNTPYAGGYVTGRHGRPNRALHALQIEIDRRLYLDQELRQPGPGFARICRLIETLVRALEARLLGSGELPIAAE